MPAIGELKIGGVIFEDNENNTYTSFGPCDMAFCITANTSGEPTDASLIHCYSMDDLDNDTLESLVSKGEIRDCYITDENEAPKVIKVLYLPWSLLKVVAPQLIAGMVEQEDKNNLEHLEKESQRLRTDFLENAQMLAQDDLFIRNADLTQFYDWMRMLGMVKPNSEDEFDEGLNPNFLYFDPSSTAGKINHSFSNFIPSPLIGIDGIRLLNRRRMQVVALATFNPNRSPKIEITELGDMTFIPAEGYKIADMKLRQKEGSGSDSRNVLLEITFSGQKGQRRKTLLLELLPESTGVQKGMRVNSGILVTTGPGKPGETHEVFASSHLLDGVSPISFSGNSSVVKRDEKGKVIDPDKFEEFK